jgi:hypothetical protein
LRRADDAWAIQMGREPKNRKALVLIGIVCDDEVKDIIDLKTSKDITDMVMKPNQQRERERERERDNNSHSILPF